MNLRSSTRRVLTTGSNATTKLTKQQLSRPINRPKTILKILSITCKCGKAVTVQPHQLQRKKYCSKSCFYKYKTRPSGLVYFIKNKNKSWFSKGQKPWNADQQGLQVAWNKRVKGTHFSPKTEFKSGQPSWNKGLVFLQNEKHPMWKGDQVGYNALHTWIARKLGKSTACEHCGKKNLFGHKIHWANKSHEYKRELTDWMRLCVSCHKKYDLCVA